MQRPLMARHSWRSPRAEWTAICSRRRAGLDCFQSPVNIPCHTASLQFESGIISDGSNATRLSQRRPFRVPPDGGEFHERCAQNRKEKAADGKRCDEILQVAQTQVV